MDHLTLDDVIEFVSLTEINEESMQLLGRVNSHIAVCRECRELVRSFQLVHDELDRTDLSKGAGAAIAASPAAAAFDAVDMDDGNIE